MNTNRFDSEHSGLEVVGTDQQAQAIRVSIEFFLWERNQQEVR